MRVDAGLLSAVGAGQLGAAPHVAVSPISREPNCAGAFVARPLPHAVEPVPNLPMPFDSNGAGVALAGGSAQHRRAELVAASDGEQDRRDTRSSAQNRPVQFAHRSGCILSPTTHPVLVGSAPLRPPDETSHAFRMHPEPPTQKCAHWLSWRTGLDLGAAREKVRVAAALADLNHIGAAMACGIPRVARPLTEARLLAVACAATAEQVERLVRGWRRLDREAAAAAGEQGEPGGQVWQAQRGLSLRVDEEGMVVVRGRLLPEVGAVVQRALEAALEQVPAAAAADGTEWSAAQRRADALGVVAESALAGKLDPGNAGDRYQVTVHVDAAALVGPDIAAGAIAAETRSAVATAREASAPAAVNSARSRDGEPTAFAFIVTPPAPTVRRVRCACRANWC